MNDFFNRELYEARKKTQSELRKKLQAEKVTLAREALKSEGIEITDEAFDIISLKHELKEKVPKTVYESLEAKVDGISENLDELLENLENGTANSIQKFFKKTEKFFKPIAKSATFGLASRAAVVLAPTVTSKLVVSGALTARAVYKLVKNKKAGKVISKESECNRILNELEITKDSSGAVLDTRFSNDVQDSIREFLKSQNVEFLDTGYLSLRQTIYSLDLEKKKTLCNIINNKLGRNINIEERLNSKKSSFFKDIKKTAISTTAGFTTGVGVATAVNSVNPAILAGPINGTALGVALNGLLKDGNASAIAGGTLGIGSSFLVQLVPFAGEVAKNVEAAENLIASAAVGGLVGAGVGVASVLGTKAVKTIKNMHNQFSAMKEQKQLLEFDSFKYKDDNQAEIEKMQEITLKSNTPEEQILFNLVYEYMNEEMKVEFSETPTTLSQLAQCISSCDKKQKAKLHSFVGKLRECNNDRSDFVNTMAKVGNAAKLVATVGLAGLSTLDIIKDGTLLPEISRKVFKNVPDNIYLKIPEKPTIDRMDYRGDDFTIKADDLTNNVTEYSGNYVDRVQQRTADAVDNMFDVVVDKATDNILANRAIGDYQKAEENYQLLEGMQKEVTPLQANSAIGKEERTSDFYDIEGQNLFETAINWLERAWSDTKEFFKTPVKEHLNNLVNGLSETSTDAIDTIKGKTEIIPDAEQIKTTVYDLPQDQLIDLAYYFNNSPKIDRTTDAYQTIGNVMQGMLDVIQEGINEYNNMMNSMFTISDVAANTAAISQGVSELSEIGKEK